jgi:tryptophanyl-tRNA synthetase
MFNHEIDFFIMSEMKKRILSGMQATGMLHLGNYLGAMLPWTKMQHEYECFFFLADLHAITITIDPEILKESIMSTTALYIASGLCPNKTVIFQQSSVTEHSELAWIFNCVTPLGMLKRMTQFKDKAGQHQDNACLGLFSYPVLMAADILLYNPDYVPVGDDQRQHLELTRDIAGIINRKFEKNIFKLPEALIEKNVARIMSLRDGLKKMSKSDSNDGSRINLIDDADTIIHKLRKAKTDMFEYISYDQITRPEITNLLNIYSSLNDRSIEDLVNEYENKGFSKFKNDLAEIIIDNLSPIRKKYLELINDKKYLIDILTKGSLKAQLNAKIKLNEIKQSFGLII